MNQLPAVEVVDVTDWYAITGTGYGLKGEISHPAGKTNAIAAAIPAGHRERREASRRRCDRGRAASPAHNAGVLIEATRAQLPRLTTAPFDPGHKLIATFNQAKDASGRDMLSWPPHSCCSAGRSARGWPAGGPRAGRYRLGAGSCPRKRTEVRTRSTRHG
jgi:hypothetical protein